MFFNLKNSVWHQWLLSICVLVLVFALAGCGDREPKQRSAFIIFLQTEIVNKNRVNLPALTKEQMDTFGEYAAQYQMLVDFNDELRVIFLPLAGSLQTLHSMASMKEMVEDREKIQATLDEIKTSQAKLNELMQRVSKQREALIQPDDVKVPFDRAYDKIVLQQVEPAEEGFPLMAILFTDALALIDFVQSKGESAHMVGNGVEFPNQEDVDKFNELNANLQKAQSDYLAFSQGSR